jgi:hypothetical protein
MNILAGMFPGTWKLFLPSKVRPDFFLWEHLKSMVYTTHPTPPKNLKTASQRKLEELMAVRCGELCKISKKYYTNIQTVLIATWNMPFSKKRQLN